MRDFGTVVMGVRCGLLTAATTGAAAGIDSRAHLGPRVVGSGRAWRQRDFAVPRAVAAFEGAVAECVLPGAVEGSVGAEGGGSLG